MARRKAKGLPKARKPAVNKRRVREIIFEDGPTHGKTSTFILDPDRGPIRMDLGRAVYIYARSKQPNKAVPREVYVFNEKATEELAEFEQLRRQRK